MVEYPLRQTVQSHVTVVGVELVGEELGTLVEQREITRRQNADQADSLTSLARVVEWVSAPVFEAGDEGVGGRVGLGLTCRWTERKCERVIRSSVPDR